MGTSELGRLERVDLRSEWPSEAHDFTPWLAREGNLDLLGDTIGITLEHEATEKNIGPFSADILCKDTATGDWVIIENQLDRTDHSHLGQILTYAAGLNAATIVWLAERFTEEHRAALDWLNEITDDHFNFFGLEIELLRINNSPPAPRFNVVAKPNDWTRSMSRAARIAEAGGLSEIKQTYLDYWIRFSEKLEESDTLVRPRKSQPESWMTFALGHSDIRLNATVNSRDKEVRARVALYGPNAKSYFHQLQQEKIEIDSSFDEPPEWLEKPNMIERHIGWVLEGVDPTDRADWDQQHNWLVSKLNELFEVFGPRVKLLKRGE